ncbi:MAG: hypothetical protein COA57_14785 [Flavobacteriales bacterium]|nr:MAG: hypothetical protein COA57_14785 [Flavobacteriales bacterium]
MTNQTKEKSYRIYIIIASVAIPVLIAVLYFTPKLKLEGVDLSFLPFVNAILNGLTTMMLILGFIAIRDKIVFMHKRFMTAAIVLSLAFLLSYVLYHMTSEPTPYGGKGFLKYLYYFILITHIVLAAAIVPLVLITYVRALSEKFDKHRKIARITLPLWLYVTITGVLVYVMLY